MDIVNYKLISAIVCAVSLFVPITGTASGAPTHILGSIYCQTFKKAVLPGPNGYEIRIFEQLCEGWGGSDTISIVLHSKKSASTKKIFVYEPMYAIVKPQIPGPVDIWPTITWVNNNEIHISIHAVAAIDMQRELADGIGIKYSVKYVAFCFPEDYKKWGKKCLRPVFPAK